MVRDCNRLVIKIVGGAFTVREFRTLPKKISMRRAALTVIVSAAVFGTALMLGGCNDRNATPAPLVATPPSPVRGDAAPKDSVEQLRQRARAAFAAGRLVTPPDDNALAINLELLARDEQDEGARQAVADLFPAVVAAAEQALASDAFEESERLLGLLERANPDSATASRMREQLSAAQSVFAQRAAQDDAKVELALLAEVATATPAAPVAVEPAAGAAAISGVAGSASSGALPIDGPVTVGSSAIRGPVASAQEPPAPSRPGTSGLASLDTAASAAAAAAAAASAPVAATAPARSTDFSGAEILTRVKPDYPQVARTRRTSGWVDLEFTVTADGRAEAIRVVEAKPENLFDRSAQRALARWRFKPAERNGAAVQSTLRTRINFSAG